MLSIWKASTKVNTEKESLQLAWYVEKREYYIPLVCRFSLQGELCVSCVCAGCVVARSPGGMDSLSLISMDTNRFFTPDVSL